MFTGSALNAAAAVAYTLECCIDGDIERAATIGRLAVETVEDYLSKVNNPDTGYHTVNPEFDAWIQKAPLMVAELQKQQQDLNTLKGCLEVDEELLKMLHQSANNIGLQPFARGMVKV